MTDAPGDTPTDPLGKLAPFRREVTARLAPHVDHLDARQRELALASCHAVLAALLAHGVKATYADPDFLRERRELVAVTDKALATAAGRAVNRMKPARDRLVAAGIIVAELSGRTYRYRIRLEVLSGDVAGMDVAPPLSAGATAGGATGAPVVAPVVTTGATTGVTTGAPVVETVAPTTSLKSIDFESDLREGRKEEISKNLSHSLPQTQEAPGARNQPKPKVESLPDLPGVVVDWIKDIGKFAPKSSDPNRLIRGEPSAPKKPNPSPPDLIATEVFKWAEFANLVPAHALAVVIAARKQALRGNPLPEPSGWFATTYANGVKDRDCIYRANDIHEQYRRRMDAHRDRQRKQDATPTAPVCRTPNDDCATPLAETLAATFAIGLEDDDREDFEQ